MNNLFITPNDFNLSTDSENIQAAVNEAKKLGINKVVIPGINKTSGKALWIIDKTIRLPSDIEIVLDNCFMQMADGVVGGFFCSETLFTDKGTSLKYRMKNIHIRGLVNATLDGGKPTGLSEKTQKERVYETLQAFDQLFAGRGDDSRPFARDLCGGACGSDHRSVHH